MRTRWCGPLLVVLLLSLSLLCPFVVVGYSFEPRSLEAMNRFGLAVRSMRSFRPADFVKNMDFSGGSSSIYTHTLRTLPAISKPPSNRDSNALQTNAGLVELHRIGREMLRNAPDIVLVGFGALIMTEMAQRQVSRGEAALPPALRELSERGFAAVEAKMEHLATLGWDTKRFVVEELRSLHENQNELVDRYLTREMLARIDRDLAPLLLSLTNDPVRVEAIVKVLRDFVALLALRSSEHSFPMLFVRTANRVMRVCERSLRTLYTACEDMIGLLDDVGTFFSLALVESRKLELCIPTVSQII